MATNALTRIEVDAAAARNTARALDTDADDVVVIAVRHHGQEREIKVAPDIASTVVTFLDLLGRHGAVDIAPADTVIGTQEAADVLNVSRPHLVKLLEQGEIPFTKAGTHRRLLLRDVVDYRRAQETRSRAAMREMAQIDRELGGL